MQRVGGDDTAFEVEAFQGVERRLDLVSVLAGARGDGQAGLRIPHADHQRLAAIRRAMTQARKSRARSGTSSSIHKAC